MSSINVDAKEITLKVVYYGPGLCGKTTSLQAVHEAIPVDKRPKMVSLATEEDRTLLFDFLPVVASKLGPYTVRLQLYTVPGQVFYDSTRKLVLQGADGVVFVADSQPAMRDANLESMGNLNDNLAEWGASLASMPHVIQCNKRDLSELMTMEEMTAELNEHAAPMFETVASTGDGVYDALRAVVRLIVKDITRSGFTEKQTEAGATRDDVTPSKAVPWRPQSSLEAAVSRHVEPSTRMSAVPAVAGVSFSSSWTDTSTAFEAQAIESMINAGQYTEAVVKCDQLVGLAATNAGYSGDNRPLYVMLCGVSGEHYRRFRTLITKALHGQPVSQYEALFAVHFATTFAFIR